MLTTQLKQMCQHLTDVRCKCGQMDKLDKTQEFCGLYPNLKFTLHTDAKKWLL